jgi:acylphosphatase
MSDTSESPEVCALHVWVGGRVQGVFFRDATRREANALALGGWVRNLSDGRVEAWFVGPRGACERALAFVKAGPPRARVAHVDVKWESPPPVVPAEFEIR